MPRVSSIGTRIELTSMDLHFHEITIGLYRQWGDDGEPAFLVHTYSPREGAGGRMKSLMEIMKILGGMEASPLGEQMLRFPCGHEHFLACRRIFIEACKIDPSATVTPRPLLVHDKKSEGSIVAESLGGGAYSLYPEDGAKAEQAPARAVAIAKGLVKLAEMRATGEREGVVGFDCGCAHDAMVGLLLGRAVNVRAAMRESEAAASRGVLAAPSAQPT